MNRLAPPSPAPSRPAASVRTGALGGVGFAAGIAWASLAAAAGAPAGPAAREALRVYGTSDGLPQGSIFAQTFDRSGYLWVGTESGAAVYNGQRWHVLDMPTPRQSNFVLAILAARDGSLWFSTRDAGVARLADGRWTRFESRTGLPHDRVNALHEAECPGDAGSVWLGTEGGLARAVSGRIAPTALRGRVRALAEITDASGVCRLVAGTAEGVFVEREGSWRPLAPGGPVEARTLYRSRSGALWAGSRQGAWRFSNGAWTRFDSASGLPHDAVRSFVETDEGGVRTLWAGTVAGLARFQDGRWQPYDAAPLPAPSVLTLGASVEAGGAQALWAGTLGGGLARLRAGLWASHDMSELGDPIAMSLAETSALSSSGQVCAGTMTSLGCLAGGRFKYQAIPGFKFPRVTALAKGGSGGGDLWVGMSSARGLPNLARASTGRWTLFGEREGLQPGIVTAVAETLDAAGERSTWVGGNNGLLRLRPGRVDRYDTTAGLPANEIWTLVPALDRRGRRTLWIGTTRGLAVLDPSAGSVASYDVRGLPNGWVTSVLAPATAGAAQTLWVGTGGGGVAILDLERPGRPPRVLDATSVPVSLPDGTINALRQDARGRIYVCTNKGVARLTPREPTPDHPADFTSYVFVEEDGLPSMETSLGAALIDSSGRLWVGTARGVARLDTDREEPLGPPKPLRLERTLLEGAPVQLGPDEPVPYDSREIVFEYALLSYFREGDNRFRSQLVGFEPRPTEWSAESRRSYTNLPAGRYVFHLLGRDAAGRVSGPIEVRFTVAQAPWRAPWAYAGYVGLAALVGYAARRRKFARLLGRERIRTRIAADLHDDIGATLTQVTLAAEIARQRVAEGSLADVDQLLSSTAESARAAVEAMRDIVWAVNPRRDRLGELVTRMRRFAGELTEAAGMQLRFTAADVDPDLPAGPDLRREMYLVFKEALNNAVKHSGGARVDVSVRLSGAELLLRVADDGRGFAAAGRGDGHGLATLGQRASSLGGKLSIESEPGRGTTVVLSVPYQVTWRPWRRAPG